MENGDGKREYKHRLTRAAIGAVCLFAVLFSGCAGEAGAGSFTVYAQFYAVSELTKLVAGDRVLVKLIVPSGAEPHEWEPTPREMANISKADLIIYTSGMGDALIDGLKGVCKKASFCNAEEKVIGYTKGDDPHIWLNPIYAACMLENICSALATADPLNKDYYFDNYIKAKAALEDLDNEIKDILAGDAAARVVVDHAAFGRFCEQYGLIQTALSGLEDEAEPTPARMAEVIRALKAGGYAAMFTEPGERGAIYRIAEEFGEDVYELNPFEREIEGCGDYFEVMRENAHTIDEALVLIK